MSNLDVFRKEYLNANTWAQRKDGVPLDLLDNLTKEELKTAECELINAASKDDTWPIIGLGHIKSTTSLPTLYRLLNESKQNTKVTIAHSIFQICQDESMIDLVLEEVPNISNEFDLIHTVYLLPTFKDKRADSLLNDFRAHKKYLVAYNATRALGLSTDEVVVKFRNKERKDKLRVFYTALQKKWLKLLGRQ